MRISIILLLAAFMATATVNAQTAYSTTERSSGRAAIDNTTDKLKEIFGKVASAIKGNGLSPEALEGKWSYTGSACMFETEALLKKAGGAAIASQICRKIDKQLESIGIKEGDITYTFGADTTFSCKTGVLPSVGGTYTLDAERGSIELQHRVLSIKVLTVGATIKYSRNKIELLFPAHQLLKIMQLAGKIDTTV